MSKTENPSAGEANNKITSNMGRIEVTSDEETTC